MGFQNEDVYCSVFSFKTQEHIEIRINSDIKIITEIQEIKKLVS